MFTGTGIFILSVILVSFVSACFLKKNFWENRYLVLLISAGVALVATLSTNYATRDNLDTRLETVWEKQIKTMVLNDSLLQDSYSYAVNDELEATELIANIDTLSADDTTTFRLSYYLMYYTDGLSKVRFHLKEKDVNKFKYWDDIYILPSENDSTAYFAKVKHGYNRNKNLWIAGFSLPNIKSYKVLYVPPTEYAAIPDSLIREFPVKLN
jgi:hypothetical protein